MQIAPEISELSQVDLATQFKHAMRRLAATVTIITVNDEGSPKGMAATAVCSVSMDPPSLLVCINKSASLHAPVMALSHFGVNLLHCDQIEVARRFSDSSLRDVRFEGADWRRHRLGPPLLERAQVRLVCERSDAFTFGTHTIVIGKVVAVDNRKDIDPLLFVNGAFVAA